MNIYEGNFLWNMETGITGALTAYMQAKAGAHVIVVEKNILGYGATLKTDGVFLKEMDLTCTRKKNIDEGKLNKYNKLCNNAIENILNIISEISEDEECKKYIGLLLINYIYINFLKK